MLSWQSMPSAASRAARGVRPARPPHRFEGMVIALALIAVVGLAVAEHGIFLAHAGALERDESNSAAYATMPSLGAIWSELRYDTVPLASTLLFRSWGGVVENTPDGLPVIDRLSDPDNVVLATMSSVGFGLSPAAGRGISELVLHGRCLFADLAALALRRFADTPPDWRERAGWVVADARLAETR